MDIRKTAIVTGGAGGIGAPICRRLAELGHNLAIVDRDANAAQELVLEITRERVEGQIKFFGCDLMRAPEIADTFHAICAALGFPGILIHAASMRNEFVTLDQVEEQAWDEIFTVNLKSLYLLAQLMLPGMRERHFGRIVSVASVKGLQGSARSAPYSASMHALIGLTRSLAAEWGRAGIAISAVCPGFVDARLKEEEEPVKGYRRRILRRTPMGRILKVEEIASAVCFLADESNQAANGTILVVDGGLTADLGVI